MIFFPFLSNGCCSGLGGVPCGANLLIMAPSIKQSFQIVTNYAFLVKQDQVNILIGLI